MNFSIFNNGLFRPVTPDERSPQPAAKPDCGTCADEQRRREHREPQNYTPPRRHAGEFDYEK